MTGYGILKLCSILKTSDKANCVTRIFTVHPVWSWRWHWNMFQMMSMVQLWLGMKRGWRLGSFQGSQTDFANLRLSKKYVCKPLTYMVMRGWAIHWLYAYFKHPLMFSYWAEQFNETHGSVTRIWVNAVLWASPMAIFTQIAFAVSTMLCWLLCLATQHLEIVSLSGPDIFIQLRIQQRYRI